MAKLVTDDYNAVNADDLVAVSKPNETAIWYLFLIPKTGTPFTVTFLSQIARDAYFTKLLEAMGAES